MAASLGREDVFQILFSAFPHFSHYTPRQYFFTTMDFLTNPEFWARWFGIVIIDLTLAGDNAVVIALATRKLPKHQQFWGRMWGTLGAVGLRVIGIMIVSKILMVPLVQFFGALVLLWIAVKLVRHEEGVEEQVRSGTSFWEAVWIIIVADLVMSLDNVIAIAGAAHGDNGLVIFGILFSLPLVVYGSGLLEKLMHRFKWIVWVGGGVLGYVAGEMMTHDPMVARRLTDVPHGVVVGVHIGLGVVLTALGWWFEHRASRRKKKVGGK